MDKEIDLLRIENQLCFLLYASSREMTKKYKSLLEDLNVTYPQYLVLLLLWEHHTLNVKELGERLFLDSGTLTPMLKRMEQNQLIKRERSLQDERSVVVSLTEKGDSLKEQATCIPYEIGKLSGLQPDDFTQLKETLFSLLQSLKK